MELATLEFSQDELKYLLALFNLVFNHGQIGSGDAIQIVNILSKIQVKIKPGAEEPKTPVAAEQTN